MGKTEISGSREKYLFVLAAAVAFVLVGVWMVRNPEIARDGFKTLVAWAAVAMGLLALPIVLLRLIKPSRLILKPDGFLIETPPMGSRWRAWSDIAEFYVWEAHRTKIVAFSYLPGREPNDPVTAMNASLGAPGNLGAHWTIQPEELLELAVAYHRAAMPHLYPDPSAN